MNELVTSVRTTDDDATLSIGALADRTGVAAATLRVWESRHGFPVPRRLASGHRRYADGDVERVREVVRHRDAGIRLDVAIGLVRSEPSRDDTPGAPGGPGPESVFARLRQTHPALLPSRLTKRTLLGLSWAIEDEFLATARRAHLFGAFQRRRHFESARSRWTELARVSTSTFVFADFETHEGAQLHEVPLPADAPMLREWAVVCDSPDLYVALAAWELPGQDGVADADRIFESLWTVDPSAVREAARVCASVAIGAGSAAGVEVAAALAPPPTPAASDLGAMTSLFNRAISYVDASRTRGGRGGR